MSTKPVSVMVVEDSLLARELLSSTLNSDPRLHVACAVDSAERALKLLPRVAPDVISMDIRLPGMDGLEATRRIMEQLPTPIVVVAADFRSDTINRSMEALRAGALAVVEKPSLENADGYGAISRRLCDQFVNMSQVKVVRQRFNGLSLRSNQAQRLASLAPISLAFRGKPGIDLIGVTASTGGPAAIARLLQGLGSSFPVPVLIVQHMAPNFLEGYANWLDSVCDLDVALAKHLEKPIAGRVYVAPGDCHLTYRAGQIRLVADGGSRGHVPSGDLLFDSLAEDLGTRGLGVLLTGMGSDGAKGLLAMRRIGAHTIVQDEATSAVYGMPAAAWAMGAATEQLAIGVMSERINDLIRRPSHGRLALQEQLRRDQ